MPKSGSTTKMCEPTARFTHKQWLDYFSKQGHRDRKSLPQYTDLVLEWIQKLIAGIAGSAPPGPRYDTLDILVGSIQYNILQLYRVSISAPMGTQGPKKS